jgi:hypothetical protein
MPWFPDFVGAVELARLETRAAGEADPVAQYVKALNDGDSRTLETVWPRDVVVYDPHAGEIRGHRRLKDFVKQSQSVLAKRLVRTETIASTVVGSRAVVELLAYLSAGDGEVTWPVGIVADRDDRSVVFRSYFSQWPFTGHHVLRAPILEPTDTPLNGIVGRFHTALHIGDTDAILGTFGPNGYLQQTIDGPQHIHRGLDELRSFFSSCFSAGGGINLQRCAATDDGVRYALEYNCTRWGSHELAPQAGIGVYERGPDGLLAAVRVYDDVEAPVALPDDESC